MAYFWPIFGLSNRTRTPLENNVDSINWKLLFPDFKSFQDQVGAEMLTNSEYEDLEGMVGNSMLRYPNPHKNIKNIQWQIRMEKKKYLRALATYNQTVEQLNNTNQTNETKVYDVGGRDEDQIIDANYLQQKVVNESKQHQNQLDSLDKINKFNEMQDPYMKFIQNIAAKIIHPLQPEQRGEIWPN